MKFLRESPSVKGHKMAVYMCGYCHEETIKRQSNVLKGTTKSCGCSSYKIMSDKNVTHDLSKTKLYKVWFSMVARCHNSKSQAYHRYGGRGIKVCSEWKDDIKEFYSWAMLNGYEQNLQLDRRNNEGDYTPFNCRFITAKENMRNNSHTKLNKTQASEIKKMLFEGIKQKEIAKIYNVDASSISNIKRGITWQN